MKKLIAVTALCLSATACGPVNSIYNCRATAYCDNGNGTYTSASEGASVCSNQDELQPQIDADVTTCRNDVQAACGGTSYCEIACIPTDTECGN